MARAPGLSVRLKLTLSYAGVLMLAGALLLAAVGVGPAFGVAIGAGGHAVLGVMTVRDARRVLAPAPRNRLSKRPRPSNALDLDRLAFPETRRESHDRSLSDNDVLPAHLRVVSYSRAGFHVAWKEHTGRRA